MQTTPIDFHYSKAIVRGVPSTFDRCIKPHGDDESIDVDLAREQHAQYCAALETLGLELIRLDPDDKYPDSCFVEDTVVAARDWAVVCHMGAASRRGEEKTVAESLAGRRLFRLEPPATLDGGDVILDGNTFYVGMTARSNEAAVGWLRTVLSSEGVDVLPVPVPVSGILHLKSGCTRVAAGLFLVSEALGAAESLADKEKLIVPRDELYAANCLSVNGTVVVADGFPRVRELIEARGYPTRSLAMTEFRKAGGSLTCLSVLL